MSVATVRASARPPPKYTVETDFRLWAKRFEFYVEEAAIPADKKARELLTLLDEGAFRVADHLGLLGVSDFEILKESLSQHFSPPGDEIEWQYRLNNRKQENGESLAKFAGELRQLADRSYPAWSTKQRSEIARNQFIQGLESPSIQLALMKQKPVNLEEAIGLAKSQYAVELAQKRLQKKKPCSDCGSFAN